MEKSKHSKIFKEKKKKKKDREYNDEMLVSPKKSFVATVDDVEQLKSPKKKKKHRELAFTETTEDNRFKATRDEPSPKKKDKKDKNRESMALSPILKYSSPQKKQKELSPVKKSSPEKKSIFHSTVYSEEDSDVEQEKSKLENDECNEEAAEAKDPKAVVITAEKIIEDEIGWTKQDIKLLLDKIIENIPDKDTLKHSSRTERLNWSKIQFNDHSAEECKEKWKMIEKKVRGYRILQEMVNDAKFWMEKPWSSFYNSGKNNRHPDMPRRPLTSYMLFYLANKEKYAKRNPNYGMTDLSKVIADKFHKLSESKKNKYIEKARVLREEYNEKLHQFLETHPNESMAIRKKLKEEKNQMPGPKRPLPPKKLFMEEKLKHLEGEEQSKHDIQVQLNEMWKNLSKKKKVPWIRWAHESEKKYLEELELYKSENPNFELPKVKPLLSKEEINILERMEGKPEKPPNSAYSLFSRLMLKDDRIKLMKFSPKERMKEISRLWASTSDQEKKQYQEKAKALLEEYKLEYATYLESLPEDKRQEELAKTVGRKRKKKDVEEKGDGKKLKQTKIVDLLKKDKKAVVPRSDSEESGGDEDDDEDSDNYDVLNDPQKVEEIKKAIEAMEPPKPAKDAFELFKEIYLTNPGNKESKAKVLWELLDKKEQERYQKKLELQKQNYVIKYQQFLSKMGPCELKIYYSMKNNNTGKQATSSDASESDNEDSSSDNDQLPTKTVMNPRKSNDSSSSSEESD